MPSISSLAQNRPAPRELLQLQLSSNIETGKVKAGDQSALSSSIDTIDASLRSAGRPPRDAAPSSNGPRNTRARVESLVDAQVKSGALTADQGAELKQVFADAFGQGRPDGRGGPEERGGPEREGGKGPGGPGGPPGGPGGPRGAGGPPPPKPDDSGSSSSSSTSAANALKELLKKLQDRLENTSTYAASGSATTKTSSRSLVVDYTA
jgi:hypothetical protein